MWVATFLLLSQLSSAGEINHSKFIAQKAAMVDLEGPDAFTLRESWWHGQVQPGKAKLVQQQLFKQNSYLFWLAVPDPEAQVYLDLYDESGQIVTTEKVTYRDGKYVLGMLVSPPASGFYFIRIGLDKSAKSQQDWALIYAYR